MRQPDSPPDMEPSAPTGARLLHRAMLVLMVGASLVYAGWRSEYAGWFYVGSIPFLGWGVRLLFKGRRAIIDESRRRQDR